MKTSDAPRDEFTKKLMGGTIRREAQRRLNWPE